MKPTNSAQCKYNKFILIGLLLTFKIFTPGFHNSAFGLFTFNFRKTGVKGVKVVIANNLARS